MRLRVCFGVGAGTRSCVRVQCAFSCACVSLAGTYEGVLRVVHTNIQVISVAGPHSFCLPSLYSQNNISLEYHVTVTTLHLPESICARKFECVCICEPTCVLSTCPQYMGIRML